MPKVLLAFIVASVVTQVAMLTTTVFLHRTLSHRSLTIRPATRFTFRVITWMTTGIRPRQWVAVHRKHHAYTDEEGDPHSPLLLGFWQVQLGNVVYYKRTARDPEVIRKYAKDLPQDAWDRVLFDHAFLGLGIGITIVWLIFGWEVGLMVAGFHAVIYLLMNAAVNAVGHRFGKKVYENTARNSQWLAWFVAGEGLHNNHHAAPTSANLALSPGEVDPGWWLVSLLVRTNQAQVRLSEVRFARPRVPGEAARNLDDMSPEAEEPVAAR